MKPNKSTDSDGFITVTYKGRKNYNRRKPTSPETSAKLLHVETESKIFDKAKFESAVEDLNSSNFLLSFKENLSQIKFVNNTVESDKGANLMQLIDGVFDIVCYGLGHFTSCITARYQLALLSILKDILSPRNIYIYDPVFSDKEKSVLEDYFGWTVLSENEEGKRTILTRTIFYMPHCDLVLYNNLLWANWSKDSLSKLILIGNSFQQYLLDRTERYLKEKAAYINYASKFVKEVKIINEFKFSDIFNNLSLHYFHVNVLNKVPFEIWRDNIEPVYDGDDELIKNIC